MAIVIAGIRKEILSFEYDGTHVATGTSKGPPCIWMTSSQLIWPKPGSNHGYSRFWSNGVGDYET